MKTAVPTVLCPHQRKVGKLGSTQLGGAPSKENALPSERGRFLQALSLQRPSISVVILTALFARAQDLYHHEKQSPEGVKARRVLEILASIHKEGTYSHTTDELEHGEVSNNPYCSRRSHQVKVWKLPRAVSGLLKAPSLPSQLSLLFPLLPTVVSDYRLQVVVT